jgi:SAM-dependent methyltransferase
MNDSSWENSHKWYNDIVGPQGHFYHTTLVLPNTLRLLNLNFNSTLLDVACGQGVLSRNIPKIQKYSGYDLSKGLVAEAVKLNKLKFANFFVHDAQKTLPDDLGKFSHAACLLALQNIPEPLEVFKSIAPHIENGGRFVFVLNHPSFRIPRMSGWLIDEKKKLQSRRVDRYMSAQKIPIATNPSKEDSETTWSFHYPLSYFCQSLKKAGFCIETIEEWCSTKTSTGKMATQENRARKEFPLFMAISARKVDFNL